MVRKLILGLVCCHTCCPNEKWPSPAMPQLPHHIVVAAAQWSDPATASVTQPGTGLTPFSEANVVFPFVIVVPQSWDFSEAWTFHGPCTRIPNSVSQGHVHLNCGIDQRGSLRATVHGVANSRTRLNDSLSPRP